MRPLKSLRKFLDRHPLIYAFLAGVGAILFWRGVWHGMDAIADIIWAGADLHTTIDIASPFWDAPISLVLGSLILLACGVFVSELLGKEIIISGLRGEKKLTERTEVEVRTETGAVGDIRSDLSEILVRLDAIEQNIDKKATLR